MNADDRAEATLAELTADRRKEAIARFAALKPHLEDDVSLTQAASDAGVAVRTAQRWLARYRATGLPGLARAARSDSGRRKLAAEVVELIEGLALRKPQPSVATLYRRVAAVAQGHGWQAPSYGSVYSIVRHLDPAMVTLAQEGPAAFRDRFELVYRRRAECPNAIWQADHTELDILILDANGATVRPWLTTVIDDHSRAVAGYRVFLGAPSALQTSLALRQAIWRKPDPAWPVCGIPDVLYVDHGSDFTSHHLEQVAADLHFRLVYSTVGRPQGRGKVERLFGTLNTELLPELPGHLVRGKPATPPRLSLTELDAALGVFLVGTYHMRMHGETGTPPRAAWLGNGWLPRMPDSLEDLDLLLVMVAKSRVVHRDGIHFQGLRYLDPTLAAYVGEPVTLRYDPRDLAEIRVFHRNRFLCRAISPEHAGQAITFKDIQAARAAHRRALRGHINERIARVADFLPDHPPRHDATLSGAATTTPIGSEVAYLPRRHVMTGKPLGRRLGTFIATKEHRRFTEFADTVRRHRYIGLCHGPAGVGKTLSARRYARWDLAEPLLLTWGPRDPSDAKVYEALSYSRTVFYTPTVAGGLRELRDEMKRLTDRVNICIDQHIHRPEEFRSGSPADLVELLVIDEAERLSATALEYIRDGFDRADIGLLLIGMPGIEKRMARYPQLYSRVGFAHHYRPLQGDELSFVLTRHWRQFGLTLDDADFTDNQAIAAIARITGGNFRLLHRLFVQIERVLRINDLTVITNDVVDAARSTLVIGAT